MQNRIAGWLIFCQLFYLTTFSVLSAIDSACGGLVVRQIAIVRNAVGLSNHYVRFNDYVTYPMAFSSPVNTVLVLIFVWTLLRKRPVLDFSADFFSIINAVYVASSAWIFSGAFFNILRH
jgi:hypothetical protein